MQRELFEQFDDEKVVCGTDEAGRGPLAGPVVAAAVILPHDFPVEILNDSKKMSEKERIKVEAIIKEKATAWAVSAISHKIIDKINIDGKDYLSPDYHVHHIDFDRTNNDLDNLYVLPKSLHIKFHNSLNNIIRENGKIKTIEKKKKKK